MVESLEPVSSDPGPLEDVSSEPLHYRIDLTWSQAQGRSLAFQLRQRMCEESRAALKEASDVRPTVEVAKTRKGRGAKGVVASGEDPIAIIQTCCSKTASYRDPQLSLKEILFRLLLADGNRPKTARELSEEAVSWVGLGDGRIMTPEVVQRLLEYDTYYGFAPAPESRK